jgi:hypothetical protein
MKQKKSHVLIFSFVQTRNTMLCRKLEKKKRYPYTHILAITEFFPNRMMMKMSGEASERTREREKEQRCGRKKKKSFFGVFILDENEKKAERC